MLPECDYQRRHNTIDMAFVPTYTFSRTTPRLLSQSFSCAHHPLSENSLIFTPASSQSFFGQTSISAQKNVPTRYRSFSNINAALKEGDKAPDFTLPTDGNGSITLSKLQGENVILYFYPKDDTPGCTKEACGFNDILSELSQLSTIVIGVSKDDVASHDKFKEKYGLKFALATDADSDVCEKYGVWGLKQMFGKEFMGITRSTFIIDKNGKLAKIWYQVKVDGHVEEVKKAIQAM